MEPKASCMIDVRFTAELRPSLLGASMELLPCLFLCESTQVSYSLHSEAHTQGGWCTLVSSQTRVSLESLAHPSL